MPILTVGHSNRAIDAFVALLKSAGVTRVADVRAHPASRFASQFNKIDLMKALEAAGLDYHHIPALGGRRPASKTPSPNGLWREEAFRNYADYALTAAFRAGFEELLALAEEETVAVMCAEADWHHCHRRIITDHLLMDGIEVRHITDRGIEAAELTPGAVESDDGRLLYPAAQGSLL